MKNIIYRYSASFFLTAQLTKKIESRIAILYPSTRYSIRTRTAEALIRLYLAAALAAAGLFLFADFSFYYSIVSVMVIYSVVQSKVYGDLDRIELKLLKQLEKFVSNVKFRFQFDGMLEDAIQDAVNHAEYEMSIHGEKLLECLKNDYRKEQEDYSESAPNYFFLTFYSICLMTLKYGDKKIEGQSMFVKNLGYLKQDIHIEELKRKKIQNEFTGLFGLTLIPIFSIKPIEKWALYNMPEMKSVYLGMEGMVTTFVAAVFTMAVYKILTVLKQMNHTEKYKNPKIEKLAARENVQKALLFSVIHHRKRAEKTDALLRQTGYAYNLLEYVLLQWIYGWMGLFLGILLAFSMGIGGFLIILCGMAGFLTGFHILNIKLVVKRQILIMEREEEVVRFQTIILMLMHIDRITVAELLVQMEHFAVSFKTEIYELANMLSFKGMDTFREAKGKTGFHPYEKLLESMIACDTMPVYKAFEDVEADRAYYLDKHKQDNEELIQKKSLIAKTIAFLPLCLIIILKLIVPFVVQGIQGLQTAAVM